MAFNFVTLIGFVTCLVAGAAGTTQMLVLYTGTDCSVSGNNRNLSLVGSGTIGQPWNGSLSYRFWGLWRLTAANMTNPEQRLRFTTTGGSQNSQCINKADSFRRSGLNYDPAQFHFTEAEKVGPMDMTTRQLNLYAETNLNSQAQVYTGDQPRVTIRMVRSYAHWGNTAWLLYPEQNYEGKPECLKHEEQNKNGDTYTRNLESFITVGSVRMDPTGTCNVTGGGGGGGGGGGSATLANIFITGILAFAAVSFKK